MDTSPEDIKQLVEQLRELTARVHRVEQLLRIAQPPSSPVEHETTPARSAPPSQPKPIPEEAPPADSPGNESSLLGALPATAGGHRENLEARIGSHWLNRIGITAVLVCAAYFLKYAFDNKWIGET